MPTAIEEFLRAYAPVTMAREVVKETTVGGCPFKEKGQVLLSVPGRQPRPGDVRRRRQGAHRPRRKPRTRRSASGATAASARTLRASK